MINANFSQVEPYRIELWQGMDKAVELLLTPDSSGKIAVHLFFSPDADKQVASLVMCYIPHIMLDMRINTLERWATLTSLASKLRYEALDLLDEEKPDLDF